MLAAAVNEEQTEGLKVTEGNNKPQTLNTQTSVSSRDTSDETRSGNRKSRTRQETRHVTQLYSEHRRK